MLLLLACATPAPVVQAPASTTWAQEGQLVVDGLERAEQLWNEGQKQAAAKTVERVYSDRWEVRLEPAMRQASSQAEVVKLEYAFGQLVVEMQGGSRENVGSRIDDLERRVRAAADEAARSFPPPGTEKPADKAEVAAGVKPIVPDVRPNWEKK